MSIVHVEEKSASRADPHAFHLRIGGHAGAAGHDAGAAHALRQSAETAVADRLRYTQRHLGLSRLLRQHRQLPQLHDLLPTRPARAQVLCQECIALVWV